MHAAARTIRPRFGHEACEHSMGCRNLFHHHLVGLDGIGHFHGIRRPQVNFMLARRRFVMAVFDRDAHFFKREHRIASQVGRRIERVQVEIASPVEQTGSLRILEVEVLDFRSNGDTVALLPYLFDHTRQNTAGAGVEERPVGRADAAEHARDRIRVGTPRQHLERRCVGERQHVHFALFCARETGDAAAIEADSLGEGVFDFVGTDGERLHTAEHIGKPKPHEMHIARFDGFHHVFLVRVHRGTLSCAHNDKACYEQPHYLSVNYSAKAQRTHRLELG